MYEKLKPRRVGFLLSWKWTKRTVNINSLLIIWNVTGLQRERVQTTHNAKTFFKKIFIKPDIHKHNLKKNYVDLSFKAIN